MWRQSLGRELTTNEKVRAEPVSAEMVMSETAAAAAVKPAVSVEGGRFSRSDQRDLKVLVGVEMLSACCVTIRTKSAISYMLLLATGTMLLVACK